MHCLHKIFLILVLFEVVYGRKERRSAQRRSENERALSRKRSVESNEPAHASTFLVSPVGPKPDDASKKTSSSTDGDARSTLLETQGSVSSDNSEHSVSRSGRGSLSIEEATTLLKSANHMRKAFGIVLDVINARLPNDKSKKLR